MDPPALGLGRAEEPVRPTGRQSARNAGAKLVLIGDDNQIQSVDAGGGFAGLAKRLGFAGLKEITRQEDEEDRRAVHDLARGKAREAIESYAARGRISLGEDKDETLQTLITDWVNDELSPERKCILASTNAQVSEICARLQRERLRRGSISRHCWPRRKSMRSPSRAHPRCVTACAGWQEKGAIQAI